MSSILPPTVKNLNVFIYIRTSAWVIVPRGNPYTHTHTRYTVYTSTLVTEYIYTHAQLLLLLFYDNGPLVGPAIGAYNNIIYFAIVIFMMID